MLNLLSWIWRRLENVFTTLDILEWMGWKAWVLSLCGGIVSGAIAAINGAPFWAIFALFIAGCLIFLGVLIAWQNYRYDNPPKLLTINEKSSKELQRLENETQNDRWHNRKKVPLRIEFVDNSYYKSEGPYTGTGISREHAQTYKIAARNTTNEDIEDVQVWLTSISPMPVELNGCIPIPLHVTNEPHDKYSVFVPAKQERLVDVVSFYNRFWKFEIVIEHSSATAKREIFQGGDGHEIELTVQGRQTQSSSRRFKIGIRGDNKKVLFMESLPQTEEETFNEVADSR